MKCALCKCRDASVPIGGGMLACFRCYMLAMFPSRPRSPRGGTK